MSIDMNSSVHSFHSYADINRYAIKLRFVVTETDKSEELKV